MSDRMLSRRRFFTFAAGIAVGGAAIGALLRTRDVAPPYPPLVIPSGFDPKLVERLRRLHQRYDKLRTIQGVAAVRQRILFDVHQLAPYDNWMIAIIHWIRVAGWTDAADLLIDAAEFGDASVRRNVAAILASFTTPLLMANGCGPRIIRLHTSETDAAARDDWRDLRKQLGI